MPPRDEQLSNPPIALIVVWNAQSHNGLCIHQTEGLRTFEGACFPLFIHKKFTGFSKKNTRFLSFFSLFSKNRGKSVKKPIKTLAPALSGH